MKSRIRSFSYALKGLAALIKEEHNARIHVVAALIAIALSWALKLTPVEWVAIIICITLVLAAELFNSAIERMADLLSESDHPVVGQTKDMAAGAVLVTALGAAITGAIIFLPKVFEMLSIELF